MATERTSATPGVPLSGSNVCIEDRQTRRQTDKLGDSPRRASEGGCQVGIEENAARMRPMKSLEPARTSQVQSKVWPGLKRMMYPERHKEEDMLFLAHTPPHCVISAPIEISH